MSNSTSGRRPCMSSALDHKRIRNKHYALRGKCRLHNTLRLAAGEPEFGVEARSTASSRRASILVQGHHCGAYVAVEPLSFVSRPREFAAAEESSLTTLPRICDAQVAGRCDEDAGADRGSEPGGSLACDRPRIREGRFLTEISWLGSQCLVGKRWRETRTGAQHHDERGRRGGQGRSTAVELSPSPSGRSSRSFGRQTVRDSASVGAFCGLSRSHMLESPARRTDPPKPPAASASLRSRSMPSIRGFHSDTVSSPLGRQKSCRGPSTQGANGAGHAECRLRGGGLCCLLRCHPCSCRINRGVLCPPSARRYSPIGHRQPWNHTK